MGVGISEKFFKSNILKIKSKAYGSNCGKSQVICELRIMNFQMCLERCQRVNRIYSGIELFEYVDVNTAQTNQE